MSEKFTVAAYIRLSREDGDKEESNSIGNQRKLLMEYIIKKEEFVLYEIYVDDGYSGTSFDRPGFQSMITDIENKKINCVVVKDLSRFGRDYIDTGKYLERYFPKMGVRFISVTEGIDSLKQEYDMLLPIKNIFNEQYARDISEKIHMTMRAKQEAGEFIGAFASYGYKKSAVNKNQLVIDEYAADIVRKIFSLYIKGYGKQKIAQLLNEEGILSPTEYKKMNGERYRNCNQLEGKTYWSYATIDSILHREIYIGNMVQGTKYQKMRSRQKKLPKENWIVVAHTHEPIIEKETWEKAQVLLKKRTRTLALEKNKNIFAGFLKCGDCGRAMSKNVWRHADGSEVCNFYCGTYRRNGKNYCTPHKLPMTVLEEIVLDDLNRIIADVDNLEKLVQFSDSSRLKIKNRCKAEADRLKEEAEHVKKLKKAIYEDYREKLLSKEEFLSYREDYRRKEAFYLKRIELLEKKKKEDSNENVLWIKRFLERKEIETLDREMIVEMISEIRVYEDKKIKIVYNF